MMFLATLYDQNQEKTVKLTLAYVGVSSTNSIKYKSDFKILQDCSNIVKIGCQNIWELQKLWLAHNRF